MERLFNQENHRGYYLMPNSPPNSFAVAQLPIGGFLTPGNLKPTEALLEFSIGHLDDGKNVIDVWPRSVLTLEPALGALLQGFVIPFLVLFDEALQADIPPGLKSLAAALQEQKQP
jgi:hypothetical protein